MTRGSDNQATWDALVPFHVRSDLYDVRGFLAGTCTLRPIELQALGDVRGERILHAMCHFGLDSLCWARRGAQVTGLDFSAAAVRVATMLAERTELSARFVQADVVDAPTALHGETFDRVVTTWGVLIWLPDLTRWAQALAACLRPGGTFHLVDVHPLVWTYLSTDEQVPDDRPCVPYFRHGEPLSMPVEGSYAAPLADVDGHTQHNWSHELGQVVTALAQAGLHIESLQEHDAVNVQILSTLVQGDDGMWRMPEGVPSIPLSFSLRASKPS